MARTYVKTKRAENQAETRQRIVEAAVDLHTEHGPVRTTISQVAERAGVQRHTVYAHFPGERDLFMACSGHVAARDPLPSPEAWAAIDGHEARLRAALGTLYEWYGRNEVLTAHVLRDAEVSPMISEIVAIRRTPRLEAIHASLAEPLGERGRAALAVAMSFHTWRTLQRERGLTLNAAVDLMVRTVLAADG